MDLRAFMWMILAHLSSALPQFYILQPSMSVPERVPGLGLTPRYEALVLNYLSSMAGSRPPQKVQIAYPMRIEDFGVRVDPELMDDGTKEPVTEGPVLPAHQPSPLLPSDFILLTRTPQSQFFGNFDAVKNRKMKVGVEKSSLPPVGGIVSNYVLSRNKGESRELSKRQTIYSFDNDDEGVVVSASEPRVDNGTSNCTNSDKTEEPQPSVAQSKPSAIALAGRGGVAQAAPAGTAVVGAGGLAIAAPSATAVAGQGTQGAIQLGGEEKLKKTAAKL